MFWGCRWRCPQWHEGCASRKQMMGNGMKSAECGYVVGEEVERRPGQIDRCELAIEIQILHPLLVDWCGDPLRLEALAPSTNHICGGVDAFNVKSFTGKIKERPVIAAPEFKCRRTLILDEYSITIGSEVRAPKHGVDLRNDACIKLCRMHYWILTAGAKRLIATR